MPTYQYACTECGHAFEQFQSFSDDALTECPECTGRLRKLFNAVGVVFKGSGFYRTDSRGSSAEGSGSATEKKADSSSSSSTGSSSSGSGDAKASGASGASGGSGTSGSSTSTAAASPASA
ncbi:FmdB family zinc ribbon protein [Nocardioides sp. SYSU DS0663]|uniref:FmdB family zinc ribbon protein n=1 Tax=Nocardioides sp. SYSU DS0663 TaxID=3416445 RepID=UPI003F4C47C3